MAYNSVIIEPGKDPHDYSYIERRAEILEYILAAGHPDMVNRTEFGKHYDVEPSTITRDVQAIRDEVEAELGTDAKFISEVVYQKAIREKLKQKDIDGAIDVIESWNKWLFDIGGQEKAADKIEAEIIAERAVETGSFRIVTDPEKEPTLVEAGAAPAGVPEDVETADLFSKVPVLGNGETDAAEDE